MIISVLRSSIWNSVLTDKLANAADTPGGVFYSRDAIISTQSPGKCFGIIDADFNDQFAAVYSDLFTDYVPGAIINGSSAGIAINDGFIAEGLTVWNNRTKQCIPYTLRMMATHNLGRADMKLYDDNVTLIDAEATINNGLLSYQNPRSNGGESQTGITNPDYFNNWMLPNFSAVIATRPDSLLYPTPLGVPYAANGLTTGVNRDAIVVNTVSGGGTSRIGYSSFLDFSSTPIGRAAILNSTVGVAPVGPTFGGAISGLMTATNGTTEMTGTDLIRSNTQNTVYWQIELNSQFFDNPLAPGDDIWIVIGYGYGEGQLMSNANIASAYSNFAAPFSFGKRFDVWDNSTVLQGYAAPLKGLPSSFTGNSDFQGPANWAVSSLRWQNYADELKFAPDNGEYRSFIQIGSLDPCTVFI